MSHLSLFYFLCLTSHSHTYYAKGFHLKLIKLFSKAKDKSTYNIFKSLLSSTIYRAFWILWKTSDTYTHWLQSFLYRGFSSKSFNGETVQKWSSPRSFPDHISDRKIPCIANEHSPLKQKYSLWIKWRLILNEPKQFFLTDKILYIQNWGNN